MKIDSSLSGPLAEIPQLAREKEALGYSGVRTSETGHNPFLPLLLAAEHTNRLELCTSIAVAFARSPMTLASEANDLQWFSKGRFTLGLGSQVRAHIERRFSMPWSHPAPRMREFVLALRAIWGCWDTGSKLQFEGEFYTHALMTPFFNPGPNPWGKPRVVVAAVGSKMAEVAGEVGDGMLVHGFTTERYLRDVTLPAVSTGLDRAGRSRSEFELFYPAFVVTGRTDEEMAAAATAVRERIAFYGSTPDYLAVLALSGWEDLHFELSAMAKRGEWAEMGNRVDDEVLDAFAVVGRPGDIVPALRRRFEGVIDRLSFYSPYLSDRTIWTELLEEFKAA